MEKKWFGFLLTILLAITLAACGSSNGAQEDNEKASGVGTEETGQNAEEENIEEKEKEEATDSEESDGKEEEVFRASGNDDKENTEPTENLFDSDKVFYYADDAVEIKLTNASFVQEFKATNAEADTVLGSRTINSDSETFLHISGTINNDTTDIFHYGHKLAPVKFFLLYDGKHEFEGLAGTEEEEGTKIGSASVSSLTEGKVHIYFQVPKAVSETDKPLVLKVTMDEEEFEIPVR
ncbi:hypothetical protein [Bacillus sinesaloumensis]|uniref:hypothetical protein n=1 Tax=Litchfieldia sinesaloumensis TaxID=1926280 RepID=UPI0009882DF6|nr:hypothetical protein [Bacillus sinesaloumensis]